MESFRQILQKVRPWIFRNARPIDLFRWQAAFEAGSPAMRDRCRESALQVLAAYQNDDGGFGHALEPDFWNPGSSPIATWRATDLLCEIGGIPAGHPLIEGILRYLASGADFDGRRWQGEVPGNNDWPHAPWWHFDAATVDGWGDNPTASLAGFIIQYARPETALYRQAASFVQETAAALLAGEEPHEMHEVSCYAQMAESVRHSGAAGLFDTDAFEGWLARQIDRLITRQPEAWASGYVCRPSRFISSPHSRFYTGNEPVVAAEAAFLVRSLPEGDVWPITWRWGHDEKAFAIAENWWKGDQAIRSLLFLQAFLPD